MVAYKIGVKLSLINNISSGLNVISGAFSKTSQDAKALQAKLSGIKLLGIQGMAVGGMGFMGLGIMKHMIKPAEEYTHQLNLMNIAGLSQKELAEATGAAWKNTGSVITTTATENLRILMDMRNLLTNMDDAKNILPVVTKMQAVFKSSTHQGISANSQEFAYSMAKALDIIGAASDGKRFETEASMMSKAVMATQGRVTPAAMQSVFQYGRQAKMGWNNEFKYEILPALIQEYAAGKGGAGGGSRGVGPMLASFYRMTNQGFVNKKSLPELVSLGLLPKGSDLKTATSSTTAEHMTGYKTARENPFQWVQETLVPAIHKKYGANMSTADLVQHITDITRGNQLAATLMAEFAAKPANFLREQQNIKRAMPYKDAYNASVSNDPTIAHAALAAQWESVKIAATMSLVPILIPALMKLANGLQTLSIFMRNNQVLVKTLGINFGLLFGAMAIGGTVVTMVAAFRAMSLVVSLLGAASGTSSLTGIVALLGKGGLGGAAVVAAGGLGYLVGTLLNMGIDKVTSLLTGGNNDTLGGWLWEAFHHDDGTFKPLTNERKRFKDQYVAPHALNKQTTNVIMKINEREVGRAVINHQANELDKAQVGTKLFDSLMHPTPVAYGF